MQHSVRVQSSATNEPNTMRHTAAYLTTELARFKNIGHLEVRDGRKHAKLVNLLTQDWIPIAGTPSDFRSRTNFRVAVRRLAEKGEGVIYAKTGRLPTIH